MRPLNRIPNSAYSVLSLCAESVRDETRKRYILEIADQVNRAEAEYIAAGISARFYAIEKSSALGNLSNGDLKKLYKETFVKSAKTRPIYDQIIGLPKYGICPQCGQNAVSTLDHYLAEVHHSALVIAPSNLVPSCADCNKAKLHSQPTNSSDQTLHPYFDNVDDGTWLTATVIETNPPAVRFMAEPPATWPEEKRQRVIFHFGKFKLGKLYATQAGAEIASIGFALGAVMQRAGADGVKVDLQSRAASARKDQTNSWRTAMYWALSESDWFCIHGVSMLR